MIEEFLEHLNNEDKTTGTVENYKIDLAQFSTWFVNRTNKTFVPEIVTPLDIKQFRDELAKKLKPGSVNRKLNSLSIYFKWCIERGLVKQNPCSKIKRSKEEIKPVKWLEREDTYKILRTLEEVITLAKAKDNQLIVPIRNKAMVFLMLHAGLRVSEVLALQVADITIKERSGKVVVRKGKGSKRREVPLNADVRQAVNEWLEIYKAEFKEIKNNDLLFGLLHVRSVQWHLKQIARKAGLEHLTPHQLRHTFGKSLADAKEGLEKIAQLMGHESIDTTRIYTQPSEADLQKTVEKITWGD